MPSEVIVGILALIGTLVGTLGGIIVSSKLVNFRLEQLEKRVGEHNNFAARMPVLEEKLTSFETRLGNIEKKVG